MADYVIIKGKKYNVSGNTKNKVTDTVVIKGKKYNINNSELKNKEEEKATGYFKSGSLFDDGYDFGDVTRTIWNSAGDIVTDMGAGIMDMGESALDAFTYLGSVMQQNQLAESSNSVLAFNALLGNDPEKAENIVQTYQGMQDTTKQSAEDFIKKDLYSGQDVVKNIVGARNMKSIEGKSVLGDKSDALAQSGGQLLATQGLQLVGVPWFVTTGVTSFGSEVEGDLQNGDTFEQAGLSGLVTAGADILTEQISGGIKFGGKTLDDGLTSLLSRKISDKFLRSSAKFGIDVVGEGLEEALAYDISTFGNWLTHLDEESLWTMLTSEEAVQERIDSFIGGAALGGIGSVIGGAADHAKTQSQYRNTGRAIAGVDGGVDALKNLSGSVAEGVTDPKLKNALVKQAESVSSETASGKGLGKVVAGVKNANNATKVGKLYDTVQNANNLANASANKADLVKSLERKGFDTKDADTIAQALVDSYNGKELSGKQEKLLKALENNQDVQDAISNIVENEKSTMGQRSQNIRDFENDVRTGIVKKVFGEVLAKAEDPATYKPLEERVESIYTTSKAGKAVIHGTDNEINLDNVEVTDFVRDKSGKVIDMALNVDGKKVMASDIDFANDSQSYLFSAISDIENITPGDATVFIRDYDPSSGQTVGEYLNGIDEAYTYGYHNYSEADMGAGQFAKNLAKEKAKGAYVLGQNTRKNSDTSKSEAIKRMRTAAQAEAEKAAAKGKEAPKAKDMTITYNDGGKIVDFSKSGMKMSAKQKGGVEVAKVLHKMGLGTNFEFFTSKMSETMKDKDGNPARVFVDENGQEQAAYSGLYRKSDGTIRIDLNAYNGRELTLNAMAHELTHFIQQWSDEKYKVLTDFLMKAYEKTGMTMHQRVLREQARLKNIRGKDVSYNEAYDEVVANAMMKMFDDGKLVERLTELKAQDADLAHKLWEGFKKILSKFFNIYNKESALFWDTHDLTEMKETFEQLQDMFAEALVEASDNFQASLTPGVEGTAFTENGEAIAHCTEDGSVQLSMHTYDTEGRTLFRNYLNKCVSSKKLTKAEMTEMMDGIEEIYQICKEFKDKYAPFSTWSDAAVVRDTHGRPVFSVVTPNGDYKMNLDFSLVCKKRRTLDAVFNEMSKRGIIDDFELGQKSVVKINEIIRKYGFETACALCFVDAKRFRQASMADSFTRLYNELVESLVPEDQKKSISYFNFSGYETIKDVENGIDTWDNSKLDFSHINHVLKTYESGTVEYKAAQYIKTHAEGRKLLLRGDFMSSKGFDAVKTQNPDVLKLYNSKKGTGGPKAAFGDVQYLNEIIQKARYWTPAKAYSVGGVRIQSFSDYVPRMVFDYVQMIYDLAATKLPAHAYTKEALFVKQFGLTGIKINMSLIPAIAEGGIAPGLDADGNYVWAGESFDYDTAKEIQNAEGYTENCGTICVGVSYEHIVKLLRDPNIRMVIPYHKSGLNPIVAHMNKIAAFHDYTNDQRTKGKDGKALENDFDFSKALHDMGENANPKAVADQYLKWCLANGYTPRFVEFAMEDNYYKLLEDFTLYDKDGNYVPQREVRAVFPTKDSAFGSMKSLIKAGLEEDAVIEGKRDKNLSAIVDEIQKTLPKTEAEIEETQVKQADRDLEADVQRSSHETDLDTDGNKLSEDQQEFFEESKVRDEQGRLKVLYHGSRYEAFTEFDISQGVWLTPVQSYAEVYAEMWHSLRDDMDGTKRDDINGLEPSVYADPDYRLYKMYANIKNPADIGELNQELTNAVIRNLAKAIGVEYSRVKTMAADYEGQFVYEMTRSEEFIELAHQQGFDGFKASENGKETWCAFSAPNQVKLTTNEVPSAFYDIRYSSQETDIDTIAKADYDGVEKEPVYVIHKSGQDVYEFDHNLWTKKKSEAKQTYGLDDVESSGIDDYVAGKAYEWNAILRGEPDYERTEFVDFWIEQTINGLSKLPRFEGRTYRNLAFANKDGFNLFLAKHRAGMDVDVDYFASTSKDPNGYVVAGDYIVHMVIDGFDGRDISDSYAIPSQQEVIYLPGTKLRITAVKTANDGHTLIYAQEVNENGKNLEANHGGNGQSTSGTNNERQAGNVGRKRNDIRGVRNNRGMEGNSENRNAKIQRSWDYSEELKSSHETDAIPAPTFYSQMGKVVEGMKQDKFGASSVISMLRGRGVKAEEIRWSGIQAFLDGKKSVTKAELLEFIQGSMLQIEETVLAGTLESGKLPDNYRLEETETDMGDPRLNLYIDDELVDTFEQVFDGSISSTGDSEIWAMDERDLVGQILSHYAGLSYDHAYGYSDGIKQTKWDDYKLDGGENYRELVFKIPGSDYSNQAMQAHWGADAKGVLAHARIQDFDVNGKKMLFIEEIQSDWHNVGQKQGYIPVDADRQIANIQKSIDAAASESLAMYGDLLHDLEEFYRQYGLDTPFEAAEKHLELSLAERNGSILIEAFNKTYGFPEDLQKRLDRYFALEQTAFNLNSQILEFKRGIPDAPFKDNYHEYVLKRLLRMAAEEGYDSIGWTTADIQSKRWSDQYAEGYRIEYDQDIPKFLKKYGKQWGATVEKTSDDRNIELLRLGPSPNDVTLLVNDEAVMNFTWLDSGWYVRADGKPGVFENWSEIQEFADMEYPKTDSIWKMDITPAMKKSVIDEGQAMYSTHETDNVSNRDLLANAFETITNGSEEYKLIQRYKSYIAELNSLENKLSEFNRQIRKIRFTEGEYDAEKLRKLESEAKKIADAINKYDQYLLSLEASGPLRKVIERERKKEAQKTKDHVKEIQENKKLRAEQTELRHKIRKAVRDLDKILKRGDKKRNVKEDMKGFVSKALELADYLFTDHISNDELIRRGITVPMRGNEAQLVKETEDILTQLYDNAGSLTAEEYARLDAKRKKNMDKLRDLLTEQRNERLNTPVYKLFDDLITEYASLNNSNQDAVKAAYDPKVEEFLRFYIGEVNGQIDAKKKALLQNMRVADMTTKELEHLLYAYEMVLHSVKTANEFFVKGMTESIEQKVEKIVTDFSSRKTPDGKVKTVIRNLSNKLGWDYEKLYYALERIGSDSFTELIMNVANSEDIVMQDIIEAAEFRDEIVKKYGFNDWDVNKKIDKEFMDNNGKKFTLTLGELMSLYAYSRREGAWDHIEYGGFVFGEKALTDPRPADSYKLSKAQCEAITNTLTEAQKNYVKDMQKFLSETMGGKGNEVSMRLYGVKMFGEKNYFPIHIAGQYKAQAQESQAKQAAGFGSMSNAGFTHAQNPNAKAPFVLEGFNEVWSDHVNEMSRYHGTVPALEDLRRVMNRSSYSDAYMDSMSVKAVMENSFGKDAVDYFDNLYREANSGAITDKLQNKSKKLLSLFRKNSVAYSLSVLVQQPASLVRAYALIDRKYFGFKGVGTIAAGVGKAVTSKWNPAYANAYNEMLKYAPGVTMAKEIGGFDTATGGSIRSYLLDTNKNFKQKWKTEGKGKAILDKVDNNAIANLPNVADKIAWIEIWNACKRETVAKHKDLATSSEEFMNIVGERFTEVIRATQVYDSIFAKSPMLKSKNIYVQMLVSFMNEPNTVANMAENAVREAARGNLKQGARTAHVVVSSIIFTNVLKSIIYALRDDDEDETYTEKYVEAITGSMVNDFIPFNYIPIARDVWSLAQGYDVERADMAIVADALAAFESVYKNITTDTDDMTEEQLIEFEKKATEANWKLAESLAAFFGVPAKNIRREIDGVIDHARIASENAGMTTSTSFWDKVSDAVVDSIPLMSKETKGDKLYDAIISGDSTYVDRMKSTYKTDDSYHDAVRKTLRENDPRIREAAIAWNANDLAKYMRIAKEIIAEKHFTQDDVVMAIRAEANSLVEDEGTTGTSKAKGLFTAEKFASAIASGDYSTADSAMEDIIQTAVANGKTDEEAVKSFISSAKSELRDMFVVGEINEDRVVEAFETYFQNEEDPMDDDDFYWMFREWNYEKETGSADGYGKYNDFYNAVQTGKSLRTVIKEYTDHGIEKKTLASQITSYFKPLYKKLTVAKRASLKNYLLNAYVALGYNRYDKSKDIDAWLKD